MDKSTKDLSSSANGPRHDALINLTESVAKLNDTIKTLSSTIAEKNAQISALKATQVTQNSTITELFTLLKKRDAELEIHRQGEPKFTENKAPEIKLKRSLGSKPWYTSLR